MVIKCILNIHSCDHAPVDVDITTTKALEAHASPMASAFPLQIIAPRPARTPPLHSPPSYLRCSSRDRTFKTGDKRLNREFQGLLDPTIESNTRLLQFTDQIFPVDTSSRDDQRSHASETLDRGVQCEPFLSPPVSLEVGVQCDVPEQPTAGTCELLDRLRTTIEVLEAENQSLKLQLKTCECADYKGNNRWTEVKRRKPKTPVPVQNKLSNLQTKNVTQQKIESFSKKKKKPNFLNNSLKTANKSWQAPIKLTHNVQFKYITVRGDSHARHIAGLVINLIGPTTVVNGVCVPGARFLDVVSPARTSSEPRPCCEVLIAGTNDLAVGKQRNIYRHLEGYIAAGSSNTEIVLTTLPHRHDLDPTHPVHYQILLLNAYIEELAARHKLRVLNFDDIGRRYFTRHGQHLSWRGKRLLAGMIVAAMRPATQGPGMTAQPRFQGNHRTTAATTDKILTPAAARGESATIRQRPASIQYVTYADAVRRSPSPDVLQSIF
ncbi:hypothetical protein J6590_078798 [Homalodisca vitripennis]|nr:hypothetical protein J6590_078798 [Homalodisca vitripennis]